MTKKYPTADPLVIPAAVPHHSCATIALSIVSRQLTRSLRVLPLCVAMVLSALLPTSAFAAGPPQQGTHHPMLPQTAEQICIGEPLHPGWFLTTWGIATDRCGGRTLSVLTLPGGENLTVPHGFNVSWIVPPPPMGQVITICAQQPLAENQEIVGVGVTPLCPTGKTWTITVPGQFTDTICQSSPIPRGYVITAETDSIDCALDGLFHNAITIAIETIPPHGFQGTEGPARR